MFGFVRESVLTLAIQQHRLELMDAAKLWARAQQQITDLERMNARLQSDLDWAKHRLTQVERERGQLIQSAIGVKIAVPEFVPTYRPDEALNEDSNPFKTVGEDVLDEADTIPRDEATPGVDYSKMPGFKG